MVEIRDVIPPFPLNPVQKSDDATKRRQQQRKEQESGEQKEQHPSDDGQDHQIDEYV